MGLRRCDWLWKRPWFKSSAIQPEDAIAVSRLIYHSYGNTYVYEDMYYPERIVALHEEGMLQSFVAVSTRRQVVAHVALMLPWRGAEVIECGVAVVHPALRSQGILKRLVAAAHDQVQRRTCAGLFVHAVTNHEYSQRAALAHGYKETALLLGYGPGIIFRKISETPTQRESTLVLYRPCQPTPSTVLFTPAAHRDLILRLYDGLGVRIEVATTMPDEGSLPERTSYRTSLTPSLNIASMMVDVPGTDAAAVLRRELRRLCVQRVEMIYAYLDLTGAATPVVCEALERLGFFFAGVFPGHPFRHTLVLQYANNVSLDLTRIRVWSPLAQELLGYVTKAHARAGAL